MNSDFKKLLLFKTGYPKRYEQKQFYEKNNLIFYSADIFIHSSQE